MSHSPLFSRLKHALRQARLEGLNRSGPNGPRPDAPVRLTRRGFLSAAIMGSGALLAGCALTPVDAPQKPGAPRVAIVGAGLAGLNCAYQLKKSGLRATIFEASDRAGGRCYSKTGLLNAGQTAELGGEFIDTGHADMLALCRELGLSLLDMSQDSAVINEAYFLDGRHYSEGEVIEAFKAFVPRLEADVAAMETPEGLARLDAWSLRTYLDAIACTGWLRKLLVAAFVTEFGLDDDAQTCLNLISMIGTDLSEGFKVFGESDERFKVVGGNQQVALGLAQRLEGQIEFGRRLTRLSRQGSAFRLEFDKGEASADLVVLALPFTLLREVEVKLDLPAQKWRAIRELSYGMCTKVMLGTTSRPWRQQGYSGSVYSDQPFQLAWDNARLQAGSGAGITLYSGGSAAMRAGEGSVQEALKRLLPGLELAFPGVTQAGNQHLHRMHWPAHPLARCAYSAYTVGQWSTLSGHEFEPVGDLYFCGEHCSEDFQGFLNGAAETGRRAAELIAAAVQG
ncbi:FAD-dependent oxidoreductase [bacterium]|nr:MAG: FAD-dependent oxidoreductase [bacterium]RIK61607.1 MAG: FAD-dependent oxidoreductase [Planctomycetota bacterium]